MRFLALAEAGCTQSPLATFFIAMQSSRQSEKGFTLIELTVVVVILGVLAALALPAYASMVRRAHYSKVRQQMGTIAKEAQMYHAEKGHYPPDVMPREQPDGIRNWPEDVPLGGFYDYDHWSLGGDQCYVQIAFVDETLKRNYTTYSLNAQPASFEEFDDNLVLGVDVYECANGGKGAVK